MGGAAATTGAGHEIAHNFVESRLGSQSSRYRGTTLLSGTRGTAGDGWRRSSRCTVGSCVEVLVSVDRVLVRDSKQNHRGAQDHIVVNPSVWRVFLKELLGSVGTGSNGTLTTRHLEDGWVELIDQSTGISLTFDAQEWIAFVEGVELGEMAAPLSV